MENKDLKIGVTRPGGVQPAGARHSSGGAGRPRAAADRDHGPFDLDAAAERLDRLLDQDAQAGGGARPDVPRRGFYLNVRI